MQESPEATQNPARQEPPDESKHVRPHNSFVGFRAEEVEQSIPARFEQQVAKTPENLAVVSKRDRITYNELNRAANRVARAILAQRGDGNEPAAFLLGSRAMTLAAILAILKAGKALVGLDPASPPARNTYMLEHSQAGVIVTDNDNLSLAKELAGSRVPIINLDEPASAFSGENIGLSIAPNALATVVYTSGSTGQPKGVIQNHRNLLYAHMVYTNLFQMGTDDRAVTLFSLAFMGGIVLNLRYLLNGACLCPFDIREEGIHKLGNWLTQQEVTILIVNPTTFRHFIGTLSGDEDFSRIRFVMLGGEVLYPQDVEMYKKHFAQGCLMDNWMGSSEMVGICHYLMGKETQIKTPVVPVGYEFPGLQVLLQDEAGRDVGVGRVGQIVVKSRYLSPGYWRDPELTQAVFSPDPEGSDERLYRMGDLGLRLADGCLVHMGREDSQVKIRGYRVEVVEVETALLALDSVKTAVVVPREDRQGEKRLVAYLVPAARPSPTIHALRRALAERLPDYMMPSAFVMLESLPLGATGKVDRKALPEPPPTRPELGNPFVAPRNEGESRLARIWEDVLGIQPIGVQDSFRDLGGDSLSYFELLLKVEEEFGHTVPMSAALQGQTVEQMARLLDQSPRLDVPHPGSARTHGYVRYLASRLHWLRSPRTLFGGIQRVLEKYVSRAGTALGSAVLPYQTGSRIISWTSGQQWMRSTVFRRHARVLQRCLTTVPAKPVAGADLVRLSIASNMWSRWRGRALSKLEAREFERWVSVSGLSTFAEAFAAGRGVVLVQNHLAPLNVVAQVLKRVGIEIAFTIGGEFALTEVYGSSLQASQLYQARQVLQKGGIARVVADGELGTSAGVTVPFFGRTRTFRAGFAELATVTGAAVVPASVRMDLDGHLHVTFLPPLQAPDTDRHSQIESLVTQYIGIIREEWTENLASFIWKHLERFLQLPPAGEPTGSSVDKSAG